MNPSCPIRSKMCSKEMCAWYDVWSNSCAILLLAQRFDAVTTAENELMVKQAGDLVLGELLETDSCSHT